MRLDHEVMLPPNPTTVTMHACRPMDQTQSVTVLASPIAKLEFGAAESSSQPDDETFQEKGPRKHVSSGTERAQPYQSPPQDHSKTSRQSRAQTDPSRRARTSGTVEDLRRTNSCDSACFRTYGHLDSEAGPRMKTMAGPDLRTQYALLEVTVPERLQPTQQTPEAGTYDEPVEVGVVRQANSRSPAREVSANARATKTRGKSKRQKGYHLKTTPYMAVCSFRRP